MAGAVKVCSTFPIFFMFAAPFFYYQTTLCSLSSGVLLDYWSYSIPLIWSYFSLVTMNLWIYKTHANREFNQKLFGDHSIDWSSLGNEEKVFKNKFSWFPCTLYFFLTVLRNHNFRFMTSWPLRVLKYYVTIFKCWLHSNIHTADVLRLYCTSVGKCPWEWTGLQTLVHRLR